MQIHGQTPSKERTRRPSVTIITSPPATPPPGVHGRYRLGLAYGHFVYRFRWIILAIWLVVVAVSIPFASRVGTALSGGGFSYSGSDSARVDTTLTDTLHQSPTQLIVVFQSSTTSVTDPAYQAEVNAFIARAEQFAHVVGVTQGGVGTDGKTTYVVVSFDKDPQYVEQQLADFHALLPTSGPARAYLTGEPAISAAFSNISQSDTERAELFALPLALLVLLIVFGTLISALMPLLLAIVSIPIALAAIYGIALHTTTSTFVLNIASIVGLGISIDYSLFMTRRFRSELADGRSPRDATAWTISTAGEAILFSGLTVIIGFAALILIGVPFMQSFGIGGALVVAAAVLAALTLLPSLLAVLGPRINALRVPLVGRLTARMGRPSDSGRRGFWESLALNVMRRPVLVVVVIAAILLGLGWPVLSMAVGNPSSSSLPATTEARQGFDILTTQFPNQSENTILIVLKTPDGSSILTPESLAKVNSYTQWLRAQPDVASVTSLTNIPSSTLTAEQLMALYSSGAYQSQPALAKFVASTTADGVTLITVQPSVPLDSAASKDLITHLRTNTAEAQGLTVLVGGAQASTLDFTNYLYGNFPKAILFTVIATYVLLLLMFRSLVLPLKAILMNVLSVCAAYGVLVFVFQWGVLQNLLGFHSTGEIDSFIPILMFCILFGLSMDYEVFLLSSIHEEWLRTHNNRLAVARGLERTGGVITNAAILFVIVTGAFTFTTLTVTKEMGLGMTVAVLVDAFIIRTLLVPATMRLLGRWNWWLPGRPLPPKPSVQAE